MTCFRKCILFGVVLCLFISFTPQLFAKTWMNESPMSIARDQFAGGVIGDSIYVFGGNGNPDGYNLDSGQVLDINTSSWSSIPSNPFNGMGVESYNNRFSI